MKKNTLFFTSFFILFFLFFQIKNINAQTTLQPGDIVVLGYNTNVSPAATSNCGNNYNTDDMIVLMTMVDIANNTEIIITDRGYLSTTSTTTHIFDGLLEGAVTFRRTGGTLAKGTVFQITFGTAGAFCGGTIGACGQGWTTTEVFLFPPSYATLDMNSTSGDNLFILQGNFTNDTDFTGKFLYGLSTTGSWVFSNSNRAGSSNLPPMLGACLSRTTNDAQIQWHIDHRYQIRTFICYLK